MEPDPEFVTYLAKAGVNIGELSNLERLDAYNKFQEALKLQAGKVYLLSFLSPITDFRFCFISVILISFTNSRYIPNDV